jgi:hypothetical protein
MGLRDRLKAKVQKAVSKLSGDHSDAAPEERKDYARPGEPNDEAEVVMARIRRPGAAAVKGGS